MPCLSREAPRSGRWLRAQRRRQHCKLAGRARLPGAEGLESHSGTQLEGRELPTAVLPDGIQLGRQEGGAAPNPCLQEAAGLQRRPGHSRSRPHGRHGEALLRGHGGAPGSPTENVRLLVLLQGSFLGPHGPGAAARGLWTHSPCAGPGTAGRCTGSWQTGSSCGTRSPRQ